MSCLVSSQLSDGLGGLCASKWQWFDAKTHSADGGISVGWMAQKWIGLGG